MNKEISEIIWRVKAFAIFTIFFAHMPLHTPSSAFNLYEWIGIWGVPTFIILSGYLDGISNTSYLKRITYLVIPLIIWGSITYALHIIKRPEDASLIEYAKWLYGCGSYLYFVFVLIWCQILNRFIKIAHFWIIIGLLSVLLSSYKILHYNDFFTPYTNPFNFILYYSFGKYLYEHCLLEKLIKNKIVLYTSLTILLLSCFSFDHYSYFNIQGIVIAISAFFFICYFTSKIKWDVLSIIGRDSYVIYLSHIQIVGFIHILFKPLYGSTAEYIKVIPAFLAVLLMTWLTKWILNIIGQNSIKKILGFK